MTDEERELLTCEACGAVLDRPPPHSIGELFVCNVCWKKHKKSLEADERRHLEYRSKEGACMGFEEWRRLDTQARAALTIRERGSE